MSGPQVLTRDDDIDVAGLFSQLWKRRKLLMLMTILTGFALLVGLSLVSPRYESSARVLIENRESVFTRKTEDIGERRETRYDEQAVGSQVEVISSDELALQVIGRLKLAERSEFGKSGMPSILNDLLVLTGLKGSRHGATPDEIALRVFRKKLNVYAVERSRVIVIEFWSNDPKLAQEVPNSIAEAFIALQKTTQQTSTTDATDWLGPEIEGMRVRLQQAEAKVAEFRANSDILVGDNNALLATQQLSEVSTELSRVRAERSSAEAKVASIRAALESGSSIDVIPEVLASSLVQRLRERQVSLQAQISDLSTSLLPGHPRLKSLNSQVSDFENQIRSAAKNILISLENNVGLTRKTEADLIKEVNRLKSEAARVGEAEVELRALEREATAERELLQTYLRRFREAAGRQTEGFFPVDARIISRATLPIESYFPKVLPFSAAGAVAAFTLTAIGILASALTAGPAMASTQSGLPIMLRNPYLLLQCPYCLLAEASEAEEMVFEPDSDDEEPDHSWAEADLPEVADSPRLSTDPEDTDPVDKGYDERDHNALAVRHAASVIAEIGGGRIIITSPAGDAGSRTAWMLARALAKSGKKTAVVDLSGGGVTSTEMLGSKDLPGLFNLMAGSVAFESVVFRDKVSPTHVVPAGTMMPGHGKLDIAGLSRVVDAIAESYEFIVIDCGDADVDGVSVIGDTSSIVVVSGIGADPFDCKRLESELQNRGYQDVVQIVPDSVDAEKEALAAA